MLDEGRQAFARKGKILQVLTLRRPARRSVPAPWRGAGPSRPPSLPPQVVPLSAPARHANYEFNINNSEALGRRAPSRRKRAAIAAEKGYSTMTIPRWAALAAPAALMGCATITQGSDDTVTVDTRPPGATCELKQGGAVIAYINPTPGSVSIAKSKDDVMLTCEKEGYEPEAGVLSSEFQAMTFGNILFGGLIGVAVDAASGAMNKYPPLISLTLTPSQFDSEWQRDQFFDSLRQTALSQHKAAAAEIRKTCKDPDACERKLAELDQRRDARLSDLETRRLDADVAG